MRCELRQGFDEEESHRSPEVVPDDRSTREPKAINGLQQRVPLAPGPELLGLLRAGALAEAKEVWNHDPVPLGQTDIAGSASLQLAIPASLPGQLQLQAQAVALGLRMMPLSLQACASNVVPVTIG